MASESGYETTTAGGALSPETRATSDISSPLELASNWPCTACTFLNVPHAASCAMCNTPRVLGTADICTQLKSGDTQLSDTTPSLGGHCRPTQYSDGKNGGGSNTEDRPLPSQKATLLASVSALNSNLGSANGGSSSPAGDSSNSTLQPCATCRVTQDRSNFSKTQW